MGCVAFRALVGKSKVLEQGLVHNTFSVGKSYGLLAEENVSGPRRFERTVILQYDYTCSFK